MVIIVVGGRSGGNLPVSPRRGVGKADPACGRASAAAPLRMWFGLFDPTHPVPRARRWKAVA